MKYVPVKLAQQKFSTMNWSSYHNRKTAEKMTSQHNRKISQRIGQVATTGKQQKKMIKLPQQKNSTN